MSDERAIDVTVFGATGFVGRLIADYLARNAPEGTKIALAGRSQEKLAKVRGELHENAADWPLVVADSDDEDALAVMARNTRVVATTVGPYREYGEKLVDVCADTGTDYCDLTGEVLFVHDCMERHERAAANGARIVNACGFDSIPSDLGVYSLYEAARADGAGELEETTLVVTGVKGGVSGGTVASLKGMIDEARSDKESRRRLADPYSLVPERAGKRENGERDSFGIGHDGELGQWVAPFVMATFNTRIVRRSNALLDNAYGSGFRYREVTGMGGGPLGPVKAAALAGGLGALTGGLAFPPTRKVLDHVLPDPGEGPSEKTINEGFFKMRIHTRTTSGAGYVARVAAQGDPGYGATAMLMGEAALCLALDRDRLPDRYGVLTPASAMDGALADRLRAAGMTLEVEKD